MRRQLVHSLTLAVVLLAAARIAAAQTCVTIDQDHDMLAPRDRTAALIVLKTQFQLAGEHVVDTGCTETYVVTHVKLGRTITVTMTGSKGTREGKAIDVDDLEPIYNQMIRSFLTGKPVGTFGVIDRGNVSAAQNIPERRVQSDAFWYARLGSGAVFADSVLGTPSIGFGYRAEFDTFGVDFSFLNGLTRTSTSYYTSDASVTGGSYLKLEGLYFANPRSNRTPYYGGGLSWGAMDVFQNSRSWNGNGMQAELTAGYEIGRAASVRLFMQTDAILPFYNATSTAYSYQRQSNGTYTSLVSVDHRYTPTLLLSIGVGWQRGRN
ncbi:MAG TPA: hypothetical protein VFA59_25865 [Vicinamibacterales bacterium]|nr:hypothetical protein [Vicinamibacterales bacterium]